MADSTPQPSEVVISIETGPVSRVRIGAPPGAAPRGAALALPAGVFAADPFAPETVPYTELDLDGTDDEQLGWIADVYGWDVARSVSSLVAGAADPVPATPASWRPGHLRAPAVRLAIARWLAVWSGARLDAGLLDAEIGHLTLACEDLVSNAHDIAREHLIRSAPLLDLLIDHALDGRGAGYDDATARTVRDLGRSALLLLDRTDAAMPRLRARAAELADRAVADGIGAVDLEPVRVRTPVRAAAQVDPAWRRASVDLVQVPAHLVDEQPDSVRWRIVTGRDRPHVEILVDAAADPLGKPGPWVRVYRDDQPLPIALGPMRLTVDGFRSRWSAELPLAGDDGRLDLVDIYSPRISRRPRTGAEGTRARCERDAVHLLRRIRALVDTEGSARLRAGVADSAVRLAAELEGLPGEPDELAGRLRELAERLPQADLDRAVWRVTLAERALARPDFLGPRYRPPV